MLPFLTIFYLPQQMTNWFFYVVPGNWICQILFPGNNNKTFSKCHLLKILPRVLSGEVQVLWIIYLFLCKKKYTCMYLCCEYSLVTHSWGAYNEYYNMFDLQKTYIGCEYTLDMSWSFMAQSTLLRSCWAGQLTYSHFSLASLDL